jgi:hypothetical protein
VPNDSGGPGNGLLYGLLGALCAVVIGGGYYVYLYNQSLSPLPQTAQAPAPQAAPPAAPAPATPGGPSASQLAQARDALANAQRLARRGDFSGAEASLQHADRIVPGFAETASARREIADLRAARGDDRRDRDRRGNDNRIAALVEAARAAIARRDYGAADRALDEAERIDSRDPAVRRARDELQEAASRPDRRDGRN